MFMGLNPAACVACVNVRPLAPIISRTLQTVTDFFITAPVPPNNR
jgi:hypothetical protein